MLRQCVLLTEERHALQTQSIQLLSGRGPPTGSPSRWERQGPGVEVLLVVCSSWAPSTSAAGRVSSLVASLLSHRITTDVFMELTPALLRRPLK